MNALMVKRHLQTPSFFRLLTDKTFGIFLFGSFLSSMGFWIQSVGQGWQVLQMTNSALLLGLVVFAATAPNILFSLFGGVIVDRMNRRWLITVVQIVYMVTALLLGVLTTLHLITVWQIIALALLNGIFSCIGFPAWQAFIGDLVPAEDLKQGIALNSVQFNLSRVIGPAVGGISIGLVGIAGAYYLNALSYVFVIVPLLVMKFGVQSSRTSGKQRVLKDLSEGLRYTVQHKVLRMILLLQLVIAFLVYPFAALLPLFARDVFHTNAIGLGELNSAVGMGALVGSLLVVMLTRRMANGSRMLVWTCAIGGLACVAFSMMHNIQVACSVLVLVGVCMVMSSTIANTAVQTLVPEEMRGRVLSILALIIFGLAPFGNLASGWVSGIIGAQRTLAIGGVLCFVLALVIFVSQVKFTPGVPGDEDPLSQVGTSSVVSIK
ncbi:MFS transporter [Dictyobacter sp. S3.2.2.5]|uniref:MFS transporter n=1 Tax=Dictyobacter halimunensis TaxID=3026934 RepID=A0ABQ6FTE1_9CHLR|nr:MFS transporter [Dictyobacter sp. S3.2.2.5]